MKILFYFATRSKTPEQTLAYKSLLRIKTADLMYCKENTTGLSKRYNEVLEKFNKDYDIITFVHDDVYVDDLNVQEKLIEAHKKFDIVGLAGGVDPVIRAPALWHLMCGGFHSGNLRGAVAHYIRDEQFAMTSFGPTPARVAILDGLFISVNVERVTKAKWQFNENYNFHHYDIASSIDANNKKLKLGVTPIWVIHKSPGLLNPESENFIQSQTKFLTEYCN